MIKLYQRLVHNCSTLNQLNRVHIALENWMTPLQLDELISEQTSNPSRFLRLLKLIGVPFAAIDIALAQRIWVSSLSVMFAKSEKSNPELFIRRPLARNLALYETGGTRSGKTLAICFTGAAQRMFMPVPVFLQHIDAERTDVALVRNPKGKGYFCGIEGIGSNLEVSIDQIKALLRTDEYQKIVTIGTSGGGMPAVLTTLRLGFDAALSAGGNSPDDPRWIEAIGITGGDLARKWFDDLADIPKLFLVYGADFPRDRDAAEALAAIIPAQLIGVSPQEGPVGHNALYPLLLRGQLQEVLNLTVFG